MNDFDVQNASGTDRPGMYAAGAVDSAPIPRGDRSIGVRLYFVLFKKKRRSERSNPSA